MPRTTDGGPDRDTGLEAGAVGADGVDGGSGGEDVDEVGLAQFAALLEDSAEDLYDNAPCGYLSTLMDGRIAKVNATDRKSVV